MKRSHDMRGSNLLAVIKANGVPAEFSSEKFKRSLLNSGATEELAELILDEMLTKLYPGISTRKIYQMAHNMLRQRSGGLAAKYHLKRALMELGPSGFPFEKFIGELLNHQGYTVKIGEIVRGKCVFHEIDVIAEKGTDQLMIECKYHNRPGIVCDVKIPLYVQSRFKDVEYKWLQIPEHRDKVHHGWVVTNTRFTSDAVQYGTCAGLHLLGWDFPKKNSLKEQVDKLELYPITCFDTLTKFEKQQLLQKNIVLCKEIRDNEYHLSDIGIKPLRIQAILNEADQLCHPAEAEQAKPGLKRSPAK